MVNDDEEWNSGRLLQTHHFDCLGEHTLSHGRSTSLPSLSLSLRCFGRLLQHLQLSISCRQMSSNRFKWCKKASSIQLCILLGFMIHDDLWATHMYFAQRRQLWNFCSQGSYEGRRASWSWEPATSSQSLEFLKGDVSHGFMGIQPSKVSPPTKIVRVVF